MSIRKIKIRAYKNTAAVKVVPKWFKKLFGV